MKEFYSIILGADYSLAQIMGYAWFFIIGYIINGLVEISERDKKSPNTPKKWSWKFWLGDNWKRYLSTILVTYIFFRFYNEISGHPFGYIDALTLGLIGDGVGAKMKKKFKNFTSNREKLLLKYGD